MRWLVFALIAACGGPPPEAPVPSISDWWVVETSQMDGIPNGTILRIEGSELQTVEATGARPAADSRLVRAVQTNVWAMDGTPLTVTRSGRALVFTSSEAPSRALGLRPAQQSEAIFANETLAKHPSREAACEMMDACLEAMRADFQTKVDPMSHVSLQFCEVTRLGIGGRYKAMRKTAPQPCM